MKISIKQDTLKTYARSKSFNGTKVINGKEVINGKNLISGDLICTGETHIDSYTVVIQDENNNFLGRGQFIKVDEGIYSTCGSVSRKGSGELLYNTMAMTADKLGIKICLDRVAAYAEPIEYFYKKISENKLSSSVDINDKYSKDYFLLEKKNEFPYLFKAYSLEQSDEFKSSLIKNNKKVNKIVKATNGIFNRAYELEDGCNKWIDREMPLIIPKTTQILDYLKDKINISKSKNKNKPS
jgi:hypothetical protein